MGRGLRKHRLVIELAEFDLLHRLRCSRAVVLDELVSVGRLLIDSCEGELPTRLLPLDQPLLVNAQTFDALLEEVNAQREGR